jgi:predicted nucleotidyltransferase
MYEVDIANGEFQEEGVSRANCCHSVATIGEILLICIHMYTLEEIVQILRRHKPELQKKYPISQLGVFGSYARGDAAEGSDIDIAVEIVGPMGLSFIAMANEIEDLFRIKVDVVPKRSIKPDYLPYVEKDIVYV